MPRHSNFLMSLGLLLPTSPTWLLITSSLSSVFFFSFVKNIYPGYPLYVQAELGIGNIAVSNVGDRHAQVISVQCDVTTVSPYSQQRT